MNMNMLHLDIISLLVFGIIISFVSQLFSYEDFTSIGN